MPHGTTSGSRWRRVAVGFGPAAILVFAAACFDTADATGGEGLEDGEGISSLLVTHNLREDTSVEELTAAVVEGAEGVRRHRQGSPIA